MRAAVAFSLQPGDWMTVAAGLYAGMEGRVVEIQERGRFIVRARLDLPFFAEGYWQPVWNEPMSAAEWQSTTDTAAMERYLLLDPDGTDVRKWRLYGCACIRRIAELLPDERCREVLDLAEQCAEGLVGPEELHRASLRLDRLLMSDPPWERRQRAAAEAVSAVAHPTPEPGEIRRYCLRAAGALSEADVHRELLRDVFGNPFEAVEVDPGWLSWQGGVIGQLARMLYDERRWSEMPVLADALEDAGCGAESILAHCRGGGPHARGCWVLDVLRGKKEEP